AHPTLRVKVQRPCPGTHKKDSSHPAAVLRVHRIQLRLVCNDLEEPYTAPTDKPFSWLGRMRIAGGRTSVWGRSCLRLSDLDFKAASRDGFGEDWPLRYSDLEPYYDLVEECVGVTGIREGVYELPDGRFQLPMGRTCPERLFLTRRQERLGWTGTAAR